MFWHHYACNAIRKVGTIEWPVVELLYEARHVRGILDGNVI